MHHAQVAGTETKKLKGQIFDLERKAGLKPLIRPSSGVSHRMGDSLDVLGHIPWHPAGKGRSTTPLCKAGPEMSTVSFASPVFPLNMCTLSVPDADCIAPALLEHRDGSRRIGHGCDAGKVLCIYQTLQSSAYLGLCFWDQTFRKVLRIKCRMHAVVGTDSACFCKQHRPASPA